MISKEKAKDLINGKLLRHFGKDITVANPYQLYHATAMVIRDLMMENYVKTQQKEQKQQGKKLYYLSMEFLLGRSLVNNLYNLDLYEPFDKALRDVGSSVGELYDKQEDDAALGNGGLGRLAACYLDALASADLPATGYSILYEYGLFRQKIVEGMQIELPDDWLSSGDAWLVPKPSETREVHFGGEVVEEWDGPHMSIVHRNYDTVLAVPHDMLIQGYHNDTVDTLRLFKAKSMSQMDMSMFNAGNYVAASQSQTSAEAISKILYPEDNHWEGKSLRLKQQYFFVSASVQEIIHNHFERFHRIDDLAEHVVIQINDTHPTMVIPEMMRILMDEYGETWNSAWEITTKTVAYTNHTVMSEALERWPEALFKQILPRLHKIIVEINRRFCDSLWYVFPSDWDTISEMAIVAGGEIRMANLAIVGAFSVNGVSALHSEILKRDCFKNFYTVMPEKFTNVTNGIAYRRWVGQANPALTELIIKTTKKDFRNDARYLEEFAKYADEEEVQRAFGDIKVANKKRLAAYIRERCGIDVRIDSLFDVQAKRLHEYKRQLLNVMHILDQYYDLKENPNKVIMPRTYIFGAKAAPGYTMAKRIIQLIYAVSEMINGDADIRDQMKVVFLEDYRVSVAEILMPAAELSEQISTCGREASGTGNMKFMMNGALTIGTLDGANVEIRDCVGEENMFLFGLKTDEVNALINSGYRPLSYYQKDPRISRVLDAMSAGIGRPGMETSFEDIVHSLIIGNGDGRNADPYLVLADFADYIRAQQEAEILFRDKFAWNRKAILNVAHAGMFAADRSIAEYNEKIWHLTTLK